MGEIEFDDALEAGQHAPEDVYGNIKVFVRVKQYHLIIYNII